MKAADIMARTVVTVDADAPLDTAIELMLRNHISGLPVVNSAGNIVGIVTEGDLLRRAETGTDIRHGRWLELLLGPGRLASDYVRAHARRVKEVMSADVTSVSPDTPLEDVVELMERRRIKRIPVVDESTLVGIVARSDLLRALLTLIPKAAPVIIDDATLYENVLAELGKQSWTPRATIKVDIRQGVVELSGTILDDRERKALRVVVENVPGVKGVVDHLCWVDPVAGWIIETPNDNLADEAEATEPAARN